MQAIEAVVDLWAAKRIAYVLVSGDNSRSDYDEPAAMQEALSGLREGRVAERLLDFSEVQNLVGFPDYYREEVRYATED